MAPFPCSEWQWPDLFVAPYNQLVRLHRVVAIECWENKSGHPNGQRFVLHARREMKCLCIVNKSPKPLEARRDARPLDTSGKVRHRIKPRCVLSKNFILKFKPPFKCIVSNGLVIHFNHTSGCRQIKSACFEELTILLSVVGPVSDQIWTCNLFDSCSSFES